MSSLKDKSFCELRAIIETLKENKKNWEEAQSPKYFTSADIKAHQLMAEELHIAKQLTEEALYTKMWEFVHKDLGINLENG